MWSKYNRTASITFLIPLETWLFRVAPWQAQRRRSHAATTPCCKHQDLRVLRGLPSWSHLGVINWWTLRYFSEQENAMREDGSQKTKKNQWKARQRSISSEWDIGNSLAWLHCRIHERTLHALIALQVLKLHYMRPRRRHVHHVLLPSRPLGSWATRKRYCITLVYISFISWAESGMTSLCLKCSCIFSRVQPNTSSPLLNCETLWNYLRLKTCLNALNRLNIVRFQYVVEVVSTKMLPVFSIVPWSGKARGNTSS